MICVCLSETNFQKCFDLARQYDLAEIRLDLTGFDVNEVKKIFSDNKKKLIATYRPGKISEDKRKNFLITAINAGAAYVDVEFDAEYGFKKEIKSIALRNNCELIVSYHNYEHTPSCEQLKIIVNQCFDMGADIAKIACMIQKPEDNTSILSVYEPGKRIVSVGMGELGKISRIAAPFLGAEFTLASSSEEAATAPGQISYNKLIAIIEMLKNS
jgi:3-dehydroquinate dehydratase type I